MTYEPKHAAPSTGGYKRGYMYAPEPGDEEEEEEGGCLVALFGIAMFVIGIAVLGGILAIGISVLNTDAEPEPQPGIQQLEGDDNGDGHIDEDESGWNCATMGNRVCGYNENLP